MTRRKRAYVPKVRGCYECSQRRVDCDRREPECRKCVGRGIKCSGLGIRYRFLNENLKRKPEPNNGICPKPTTAEDEEHEKDMRLELSGNDISSAIELAPFDAVALLDYWYREESTLMCNPQSLAPWKEFLLDHFSKTIAPEMVLIDDRENGWRSLVLPMAQQDDLVMDAVLSASAFHFTASIGSEAYDPLKFYTRTIGHLKSKQNLMMMYDRKDQQALLIAILVLLVTVAVNGGSDFPILMQLLECALNALGGEAKLFQGEQGDFLQRQISKLRGYAVPLIDPERAVSRLSLYAESTYEDLDYYLARYPDRVPGLSYVLNLQQQACALYTSRALSDPITTSLFSRVERFKATLENFPADSGMEHVLVWATFIAACESSTLEQRQYFEDFLLRHYRRNNFANIAAALNYLKTIWSLPAGQNWTQVLPQFGIFIL